MGQARSIQVLLVENDAADARRVAQMLRRVAGRKFHLRLVRNLSAAQRLLEAGQTDVALLNLRLPDAQGLNVVSEAQKAAPWVPVLVLSNQDDNSAAAAALQQGAQDFLFKGDLTGSHLTRALLHAIIRQKLHASLRVLILYDELTGLYNRRGFITLAENRQKLAARQGVRSCLVFGDLDGLKLINDTFGHQQGDRALVEIAGVFRECFRDSDIVARIGGDEFCALLTDSSEFSEAGLRARLHEALEERNRRPDRVYQLSLSVGMVKIGVACDLEQELARADAQMYEHKRHKRIREIAILLPRIPSTV